jgi:hypothetical protein
VLLDQVFIVVVIIACSWCRVAVEHWISPTHYANDHVVTHRVQIGNVPRHFVIITHLEWNNRLVCS